MTVRGGGLTLVGKYVSVLLTRGLDMYRNSTLPNLSFGESRSATRARTWLAAWMLAWMLAWMAILI